MRIIKILVDNDQQARMMLDHLEDGELDGALDFAFNVKVSDTNYLPSEAFAEMAREGGES